MLTIAPTTGKEIKIVMRYAVLHLAATKTHN